MGTIDIPTSPTSSRVFSVTCICKIMESITSEIMSSITATDITMLPIFVFNIPSSSKIIALTGTDVTDNNNPINSD